MSATIQPPTGAARLAFFTPVREYPPLADRKASVLLAAYGLMVTVLLMFSVAIESIISGPVRWLAYVMVVLLTPLSVLILLGAWNAFHALTRTIPPMPDSLAFYPHIASRPLGTYLESVKSLDYERAIAAMLHYNYSLATLSVQKFRLVDRSIWCARSTVKLWMLLLLLIAIF